MFHHAAFVHLHVHTAYSLLEGAIKIKDLVGLCKRMAMPAVAITDTNNLFGAMEFSLTCCEAGIQPIIGCHVTIREEGIENRGKSNRQNRWQQQRGAIVLLVQNAVGYANLLKIISHAYLNCNSGLFQISLEELDGYSDGLLLLTGNVSSPVGCLLAGDQLDIARRLLERLSSLFPDRTYIEIQRHGLNIESHIEPVLVELAYTLDLPLVATNEPFFITPDLYEAHDVLLCIASGTFLAQDDRYHLTREHYFKSAETMAELFSDLPEAIINTKLIAQRCGFMLERRKPILPPFHSTSGYTEAVELRTQAEAGLQTRLAFIKSKKQNRQSVNKEEELHDRFIQPYQERLEHELNIIEKMGFPGYFLIVSDFIRWAKANGITVGPGRGSGAGSLVAWALTITDLDPLHFGLLFERFLNPERVSMPDFDIDFCQEQRDRVIRYVQRKYGYMNVAQIITFGKLQARAVLRDVGRVLQIPYNQVDRICKLVPYNPANPISLEHAIAEEPRLRNLQLKEPVIAQMLDISMKLEGLYRHASTHAAGVVIGDRRLDELVPLYRDSRSEIPVTHFNMKWIENTGLVKFDFLGLKTLTVLSKTVDLIRKTRGIHIDLSNLPSHDWPTFQMLSMGETSGIFQLESIGMRDVLRSMKPDKIEDIIAVLALYRPGPIDNIPAYIRRKHGQEEPDYLHPCLKGILKETYGIIVYQEQVMQIAQELAGYSLGRADLLRRAMGKKIKEEMEAQRKTFISSAITRGVLQAKASEIFELVAKFAEYGFNKSHAAAYAMIAYQAAYLKANYPVEFMAATMTLDMHNIDKLTILGQELRRLDIKLLLPDVNQAEVTFSSIDGTTIRYALGAIRNVSVSAVTTLVEERKKNGLFLNLADLANRFDPRTLNKRQMENLIKAGTFDSLEPNRARLLSSLDRILRIATTLTTERSSQQASLFCKESTVPPIVLTEQPDWSPIDKLEYEKIATGFYLSAHPFDVYIKLAKQLQTCSLIELIQWVERGNSGVKRVTAVPVRIKERTSWNGTRYAFVTFSDATGNFDATLFSEVLASSRELLSSSRLLLLTVDAKIQDGSVKVVVQKVEAVNTTKFTSNTSDTDDASSSASRLEITISNIESLGPLQTALTCESPGRGTVAIYPTIPGHTVEILLPEQYALSSYLLKTVRGIAGVIVRRVTV